MRIRDAKNDDVIDMTNEIAHTPQAPAFKDYPASHSMDTTWYAVDENGEIGEFDDGGRGSVPVLEGMEPSTLDEQIRNARHYTKANQYNDQYSAIHHFFCDDKDIEDEELKVHLYSPADEGDTLIYWQSSHEKPLTLDDLPKHLRSKRYFLRLKNYDFASREPINIFDHVTHCYREWSNCLKTYPEFLRIIRSTTSFPVPEFSGNWYPESWEENLEDKEEAFERGFFAMDDAGYLALFRTDRFGAIPLDKFPGNPLKVREQPDAMAWLNMIGKARGEGTYPVFARMMQEAEQWWDADGPAHWLEYPFGPASPRLFGLYHYDASWHYPIPYLRVGVPREPLHYDQLDEASRERMSPVHLPGIVFAETTRIQPYELVPSSSISREYNDESCGWCYPQLWIDTRIEHIHLCHEFAVFKGSEELLLKRARLYVDRVDQLFRS